MHASQVLLDPSAVLPSIFISHACYHNQVLLDPSARRKRSVGATAGTATGLGELGYAPLDVFDLWQRHLARLVAWLQANPSQASEVMEATVRLLSGSNESVDTHHARASSALATRNWRSMETSGCTGRFTPEPSAAAPADAAGGGPGAGGADRAGWAKQGELEAAAAAAVAKGDYVGWLRAVVSPTGETEINVQLGELTLKRHHMQLLETAVTKHTGDETHRAHAPPSSAQGCNPAPTPALCAQTSSRSSARTQPPAGTAAPKSSVRSTGAGFGCSPPATTCRSGGRMTGARPRRVPR